MLNSFFWYSYIFLPIPLTVQHCLPNAPGSARSRTMQSRWWRNCDRSPAASDCGGKLCSGPWNPWESWWILEFLLQLWWQSNGECVQHGLHWTCVPWFPLAIGDILCFDMFWIHKPNAQPKLLFHEEIAQLTEEKAEMRCGFTPWVLYIKRLLVW